MKKILILIAFILLTQITFGQGNMETEVKIWNSDNYCEYPKDINVNYHIKTHNATWPQMRCKKVNKKNLTAVHITFVCSQDTTFYLDSHFENIELIKKNGEIVYPIAMLKRSIFVDPITNNESDTLAYLSNRMKAISFQILFKADISYDIVFVFEDVDCGDTIKIDDFIKEEIKE